MPYTDHFKNVDDLIEHLDPIFQGLKDEFIESRYTGFLAVSSVTVLELSMKAIFVEFASRKHKVFGSFCLKTFNRINGNIGLSKIEEHLRKFGGKYENRFLRSIKKTEKDLINKTGKSVKTAYGNLLTWRNGFAHEGNIPSNATYAEIKHAYNCGKIVMDCLANCLKG